MEKIKKVIVSLYMDAKIKALLKEIARREKRDLSAQIVMVLEQYINEHYNQ